jgi:enoyl-CoA hydratase/carnithine racemase
MGDLVLYEIRGLACWITLNRPEKHNCIHMPMLRLLDGKLIEAANHAAVKVVVVSGAGTKAFSSGADLKAFGGLAAAEVPSWIRSGNSILNRLATISKPTIAVVQGYAYGGGLELALACDFRIATPDAKFCSPELQRGWVPGWGGLTRLRGLLGEARAKEIAFLGDVIDGTEAARIGLVTKVVPLELLDDALLGFIERLAAIQAAPFAAAKAALSLGEVSNAEIELQVIATLLARGLARAAEG